MADVEAQNAQVAQTPENNEQGVQEQAPADIVSTEQSAADSPSEVQAPAGVPSPAQPASAAGKLSRGSSKKQITSTLPSKPSSIKTSASDKSQRASADSKSQSAQPTPADGKPKRTSANGSSTSALDKIRAARADAAAAAAGSSSPDAVASTINKAKEALAKARSGALNGGHSTTKLPEGVGIVSDKPFTLYGRPEPPKPKAAVHISAPSGEENARRKAWLAEKEAMKQRRIAQEEARKQREAAAKDAAAAAKHEAHRKLMEERKAKYEAFKAREHEMQVKSEAAWKQFQEQRGRPPLFKLMEEDFKSRKAAEEEAKRAQYEAEIAAGKMATVSQLVKGEVIVKPPPGAISPGRSVSPGGTFRGSGEYSQTLGQLSPNASTANLQATTGKATGQPAAGGKSMKWPGAHTAAAAVAKQVVDRACSPLIPDGSIPPGAKVMPTRLGRAQEAAAASPPSKESSTKAAQIHTMQQLPGEQHDLQEDEPVHGADGDDAPADIEQQQQDEEEDAAAEDGEAEEADADADAAAADEDQQLHEEGDVEPAADAEAEEQEDAAEAEEVDADIDHHHQQGEEGEEEQQQEEGTADEAEAADGADQQEAEGQEADAVGVDEQQLDEQADGQEQDDGAAAEVDDAGTAYGEEPTAEKQEQH